LPGDIDFPVGGKINVRVTAKTALKLLLFLSLLLAGQAARAGESMNIAAAADLKFALDEIVSLFNSAHPGAQIETSYGSSGQFSAQIRQGAPYDMFFSADSDYPRALKAEGYSASEVQTYGTGRIVLWGSSRNIATLTLQDLRDPVIRKIALANPQHAPYGKRAEQALRAAGLWETLQQKLVYGENIAQAAQYVQSGSAQVGIIALSQALSPELGGSYALIPDGLYQPLVQGFIITRHGAANPLAREFALFIAGHQARAVMSRYGFALEGEAK
jgi:molybdate transport system substrate-binding protein